MLMQFKGDSAWVNLKGTQTKLSDYQIYIIIYAEIQDIIVIDLG